MIGGRESLESWFASEMQADKMVRFCHANAADEGCDLLVSLVYTLKVSILCHCTFCHRSILVAA